MDWLLMAAWVGVGKVSAQPPEEIAAEITAQDSAPTGQTVETGCEMAKVVRQEFWVLLKL